MLNITIASDTVIPTTIYYLLNNSLFMFFNGIVIKLYDCIFVLNFMFSAVNHNNFHLLFPIFSIVWHLSHTFSVFAVGTIVGSSLCYCHPPINFYNSSHDFVQTRLPSSWKCVFNIIMAPAQKERYKYNLKIGFSCEISYPA